MKALDDVNIGGDLIYPHDTKGDGKVLTSDADGKASWTTPSGNLPSGTVNQTLRHNGTTWESTSNFILQKNGTGTEIDFKIQHNTTTDSPKVIMHNENMFSYATIYQASDKFIELYTNGSISQITARGSSPTLRLIKNTSPTTAAAILVQALGSLQFTVLENGTIFSNSLAGTGTAPLEANAGGYIQRTSGFTGTKTVNGETWTFANGILKSIT